MSLSFAASLEIAKVTAICAMALVGCTSSPTLAPATGDASTGDICTNPNSVKPVEFVFSFYAKPPSGTTVDRVESHAKDLNAAVSMLKRAWGPLLFAPIIVPSSDRLTRLSHYPWPKDNLGLPEERQQDFPLAWHFQRAELPWLRALDQDWSLSHPKALAYKVLRSDPPYTVAVCVGQCSFESNEPTTKLTVSGDRFDRELNFPLLSMILGVEDACNFSPGHFLTKYYIKPTRQLEEGLEKAFSALFPFDENGRGYSSLALGGGPGLSQKMNDTIARSQMAFLTVLAQSTTVTEKTEGDWHILHWRLDPTMLCKMSRPIKELYVQ